MDKFNFKLIHDSKYESNYILGGRVCLKYTGDKPIKVSVDGGPPITLNINDTVDINESIEKVDE